MMSITSNDETILAINGDRSARGVDHRTRLLTLTSVDDLYFFFFQAEDGIRDYKVTGVQTCALPISAPSRPVRRRTGLDGAGRPGRHRPAAGRHPTGLGRPVRPGHPCGLVGRRADQIGRASCRERV